MSCIISLLSAKPSFLDRIPNGHNPILRPVHGIGHMQPKGGGALNQFGKDFENAGQQWTVSFCQLDSDGDGFSNGEELGDPMCLWKEGDSPQETLYISSPGIKESIPGLPSSVPPSSMPPTGEPYSNETVIDTSVLPLNFILHISIMYIVFLFLIPLALAMSCFREHIHEWLFFHSCLNFSSLLLVFIAIILVTEPPLSTHGIFGLSIYIILLFQYGCGSMRPKKHPDTLKRNCWEVCHRRVLPFIIYFIFISALVVGTIMIPYTYQIVIGSIVITTGIVNIAIFSLCYCVYVH